MTPLRILAVQTGFLLTAGGARADYETLAALARLGHDVRAIMPAIHRPHSPIPGGATVRYIPARGLKFPQSLGLVALPWILRETNRFRPDLIRDHSPYTFALACIAVERLMRVPIVGSFHHPDEGWGANWVERSLLRHYTHVTTVSNFSAKKLMEIDPALARKSTPILDGISLEFGPRPVDAAQWRAARNVPADAPVFCVAGSLIPRKNHSFLIEVMEAWSRAGRAGVLVVVGGGSQRQTLAQTIRDRGLSGRVLLWGHTSQEDYLDLLNVATAFLFPSLMEGFGIAPAEAMACGAPAIVSDRGSLPEIVADGVTGFVLPIDRGVEPWIAVMMRLCDSPELRGCMGQAAAAEARRRFDWDRVGRETAAVYERVAAEYRQLGSKTT